TRDNKRHNHQTAASSITVPVVPHLVRTQNLQRCRLAGRTACSDQSVFDCEDDLQQTAGKWRRFFQKALQGKTDLPGYYGSSQGCLQNLPRLWLIRLSVFSNDGRSLPVPLQQKWRCFCRAVVLPIVWLDFQ